MSQVRIGLRRDVSAVLFRCVSFAVGALLPAVLMVPIAACGHGPGDKLQGKWVGERIDNVSAEQLAAATAWVKATTFEFSGDKLTVTIPSEAARKGTFKVTEAEGEKLVLSMAGKNGAARDETTLTLADPKTLRWDIGQNREVTLVRAQ